MDADTPVFAIAVAAELAGMHPQTLRQYDRIGLVVPGRTSGGSRRYSTRNIEQLREVAQLSSEGVSLPAIARLLDLEDENRMLRRRVAELDTALRAERENRPGVRVFADYRGELDLTCEVLVVGSGPSGLSAAYPGRVNAHIGYSNEVSHLIEAGSDFFLMPSLYEPCGLNQIYSLRYGTVPIVRATGGLDDTVTPYDPAAGAGNGFKFGPYTAEALHDAVERAIAIFEREPDWTRIRRNAMACDFSWDRAAREYERVYLAAVSRALGRGGGGGRA